MQAPSSENPFRYHKSPSQIRFRFFKSCSLSSLIKCRQTLPMDPAHTAFQFVSPHSHLLYGMAESKNGFNTLLPISFTMRPLSSVGRSSSSLSVISDKVWAVSQANKSAVIRQSLSSFLSTWAGRAQHSSLQTSSMTRHSLSKISVDTAFALFPASSFSKIASNPNTASIFLLLK